MSGEVKNAYYLSIGLANLGHDVWVVTDGTTRWKQSVMNVNAISVGSGALKGFIRLMHIDILATRVISRLHREEAFDIVHAHVPSPLLGIVLPRLRSTPVLLTTAHGTGTFEIETDFPAMGALERVFHQVNAAVIRRWDRFAWQHSQLVISAGDYQIREMLQTYDLPPEKLEAVSNGVDTHAYAPSAVAGVRARKRYGLTGRPVILFVGRLARKKGAQYLLEAAPAILRHIPDAVFCLVGGTDRYASYEPQLRSQIQELGLDDTVMILKGIPEEELPAHYNMADVCVVPSIEYEPLPTVIFEAMATGIPIIASDLGGIPEQLGRTDGLVEPGDAGALGEAIMGLLDDEQRLKEHSKWSVTRARSKFNLDSMVKSYQSVYEELIRA